MLKKKTVRMMQSQQSDEDGYNVVYNSHNN